MSLAEELNRRLEGGKFRLLNERMYHGKGLGDGNLELYHKFYNGQVKKWPVNPLDVIIGEIKGMGEEVVIADIGCGEARMAGEFKNVISLDLHPVRKDIIRCDMRRRIPLGDGSVDVAVCCLSMMAEDISVATKEVNRILRTGGRWYVAEVRSRIGSINFLGKKFETFGFEIENVDVSSNHFVLFTMKKRSGTLPNRLPKVELRPCLYRKR